MGRLARLESRIERLEMMIASLEKGGTVQIQTAQSNVLTPYTDALGHPVATLITEGPTAGAWTFDGKNFVIRLTNSQGHG